MSNLILICDVFSLKDKQQYGKAGDKIKVISKHDDIWIVENENGNRFSVNCRKIGVEEKKVETPASLPPISKQQLKPVPAKRQKQVPANQTNLF